MAKGKRKGLEEEGWGIAGYSDHLGDYSVEKYVLKQSSVEVKFT